MTYQILHGSNLDILPTLADNSVDAIVTDPPYGLSDNKFVAETITRWIQGERDFIPDGKGFMGKAWDAFVPPPAVWDECLRVLKPGGHLLAFFGSRTQDIGALSIRLAGFEIRDSIAWMYGSGFPKSLDISKSIEAKLTTGSAAKNGFHKLEGDRTSDGKIGMYANVAEQGFRSHNPEQLGAFNLDASTPEAQQWEGWGTALKPAFEPIVVARKPLIGTVAENVLTYGTGGLNIDGSRIGTDGGTTRSGQSTHLSPSGAFTTGHNIAEINAGRWPANVILDEYSAGILDEQSGISKSNQTSGSGGIPSGANNFVNSDKQRPELNTTRGFKDSGGASRFFYVAKASKRDRNEGLEGLPAIRTGAMSATVDGTMLTGSGNERTTTRQNFHPTVKPTDLMRYLIKLVTPPGGTVLDPFTGSGSTGKAAILEGFDFIGIELTDEYIPIIQGRLAHAAKQAEEERQKKDEVLF